MTTLLRTTITSPRSGRKATEWSDHHTRLTPCPISLCSCQLTGPPVDSSPPPGGAAASGEDATISHHCHVLVGRRNKNLPQSIPSWTSNSPLREPLCINVSLLELRSMFTSCFLLITTRLLSHQKAWTDTYWYSLFYIHNAYIPQIAWQPLRTVAMLGHRRLSKSPCLRNRHRGSMYRCRG